MRVRINITSLSADERSQYVKGIKLLKKETGIKTDLNSKPINTYDYYVDIHNDTVNHPSTPPKGTINDPDAAHRGPAFLPWHRAFLLQFEADLQRVLKDPSYSLPYWDWAADAALLDPKKALVWSNDFMGGDGNPVTSGPFKKGEWSIIDNPHLDKDGHLSADLYRAFEDNQYGKKLPTQEEVDQAMNVTPYDCSPWNSLSGTKPGTTSFRNTLEGFLPPPEQHTGLHNRVHLWVGGAMGPAASPNDPIFFLHHCNVDRLWAEWQEKHPNEKYLPESGGPKDHNLNDPMWSVNKTPASQLDHRKLGYVYDSGFSFTKDNDYIPYIVEKALMELDKDPVQSPKVPWPSAKPSDSYKWAAEWTHFHSHIADYICSKLSATYSFRWIVTVNDGDEDGLWRDCTYPGRYVLKGFDKKRLNNSKFRNKNFDVIVCGIDVDSAVKMSDEEAKGVISSLATPTKAPAKWYRTAVSTGNFPAWSVSGSEVEFFNLEKIVGETNLEVTGAGFNVEKKNMRNTEGKTVGHCLRVIGAPHCALLVLPPSHFMEGSDWKNSLPGGTGWSIF